MLALSKSKPSRAMVFLMANLATFAMLIPMLAGAWLLGLLGEGAIIGMLVGLSVFFGNAVVLILLPPDLSSPTRPIWGAAFLRGVPTSAVSLLLIAAAAKAFLSPSGYWGEDNMVKGLVIMIALALGGQMVRRYVKAQGAG